jgi:hypothetical protein
MAITVKHNKVSTIPDTTDTSLVRPSDWNADHTLVGTIDVANGGTGASTLTGYVKGNGTSAMTAVATVPSTDITGLGTMSTQNANAVVITGGTIDGTTIGATIPSSVNATTITGQTSRLNGTGSNLLTYSQDFTQGVTNYATTITLASGTAPDSTNTANKFVGNSSVALHALTKSTVFIANTTYTFSIYLKKAELQYIQLGLDDGNANGASVNIDLNTMTAVSSPVIRGTGTGFSVTITSVGSGWSRIALTGNPSSAIATTRVAIVQIDTSGAAWTASSTGNGTSGYLIWGAQLEANLTANTYIPTTTTAVYGTPTLSFSGVAGLGLQSDGSLYVSPAGTGALQAQATTSTTAGGNARGANAVDWQTSRNAANQVASAGQTVVGGGAQNIASGQYSVTAGGITNGSGAFASVVSGGWNNFATGPLSVVVGGYSNTAAGYFNFIGNGSFNSATANAAVTTQSGTMNTTTAVTLSGSNANIKVGQYITGTSIASDTYVAAISGTSLTLSKVASGSSTSTLSFFTPHGIVVGGGNNQATGSYSFIGGGGDAGSSANRNVASGDWSFVGGGRKNTASGAGSVVSGGGTDGTNTFANTASGTLSFIGGGWNSTAGGTLSTIAGGTSNNSSGASSFIGGGDNHAASGGNSAIMGGRRGTTRSITGYHAFPACYDPLGSTAGASQAALLVLAKQTTDATATALTCDGGAASGTNQVILPNNSAYFFTGEVVSGVTGGGDTKGWTIEGVIKRGANAASTALVGTPTVTSMYADLGAATWTIAVTADTTNGGLRVTFTGQASTTIRTVCQIRTTEMTY